MNYNQVKNGLTDYDNINVIQYTNYLKQLETAKKDGQLVNKWFPYFKDDAAIDIFKKVAIDNLYIDGESITLQYKGKIIASYDYHAYKNRVLNVYPESTFDMQIVNKDDDFSFHKENGKVIYSHKINNPFNPNPEIIGTYCIIKNKRGEFLETLNMTEIQKMKSAAKTKNVWDNWFSEMVLKSVIKRACKRHFKDITQNIDTIDNENYDVDRVDFDETIQKKIELLENIQDLNMLYRTEQNNVSDKVKFVSLLTEKKEELKKLLPEITKDDHKKAIGMLKKGYKPNDLLSYWKIETETMETLISDAI